MGSTKIFPAQGLVAYAIGLALLSSLLMFAPGLWPLVLAGWLLPLVPATLDLAWLWRHAHRIEGGVTVPPSAIRGDTIHLDLEIDNTCPRRVQARIRPILPARVEPDLFETRTVLRPLTPVRFDVPLRVPERGSYHFGDIYLRVRGPLGMLQAQRRLPSDKLCKVYPDVRSVKEYIVTRRMHSVLAPHVQTARLRGIGSEFESLRDYEDGDDVRRMDWKATARHGKLIVRNHEIEHFRNVCLVLDRGRLMAGRADNGTKLDHAIDAALMLAGVALDGGDRCGMMVFDQDVLAYLPPRHGMGHLQILVEALHNVQPTLTESHFRRAFIYLQTRLTKRSLIVVLTDIVDAEASAATVAGLLSLSRRHLVVLAALRTPEIEDVLDEPVDSVQAPYRKAIAHRLLRERAATMTRLERGGVHVLDVRPEQVTIPVINKYIELREANLL